MSVIQYLTAFFQDARTATLLLLIVTNVVVGIAAALRTQVFQWKLTALFYETKVLPYVLGYLLIYSFGVLGVAPLLGSLWEGITQYVGVAPALVALTASIVANIARIQTGQPDTRGTHMIDAHTPDALDSVSRPSSPGPGGTGPVAGP